MADTEVKPTNIEDPGLAVLKEVFVRNAVGSRAVWSMATELLFLLAPLFVVGLLLALTPDLTLLAFFKRSDISLLSAFIFGQAAIKVFQFPQRTFILKGNEVITGLVALVICLGILPSTVIFCLAFNPNTATSAVLWLQPILLVASVLTYSLFAFITTAATIISGEAIRRLHVDSDRATEKVNA